MNDAVQAQFLGLIAGAALASTLLGVAAFEASLADAVALQAAVDNLASRMASAGCSAARPVVTVELGHMWKSLPTDLDSFKVYPNHLRALRKGGEAVTSIEYPPFVLPAPLEIAGASLLRLAFDPVLHGCTVEAQAR